MYKATIKNKEIIDGMFSVDVEFTDLDNDKRFTERFETNQAQTDTWIEDQVARKIANLERLSEMSESTEIGSNISSRKNPVLQKSPDRIEFENDLANFSRFVSAAQQGIASRESAEFIAMRDKLKANFSTEYLDLF